MSMSVWTPAMVVPVGDRIARSLPVSLTFYGNRKDELLRAAA
jgi:Asp-tRNA(Asn)/Glu-tRNA(Gln) amidotransferase A subunit family amidase